jgi:hypothetical protein
VISEVLPTDWSPRRTIFVRLRGEEEKSAVAGVLAMVDERMRRCRERGCGRRPCLVPRDRGN